ncbi:E4, partial [Macaca mulatta papillomavirus 5]|uniref:E4 n=1 Tax=Macaca mulatta papillomavirus 5 TaxID=2364645 RepID=UPI000EB694CB
NSTNASFLPVVLGVLSPVPPSPRPNRAPTPWDHKPPPKGEGEVEGHLNRDTSAPGSRRNTIPGTPRPPRKNPRRRLEEDFDDDEKENKTPPQEEEEEEEESYLSLLLKKLEHDIDELRDTIFHGLDAYKKKLGIHQL